MLTKRFGLLLDARLHLLIVALAAGRTVLDAAPSPVDDGSVLPIASSQPSLVVRLTAHDADPVAAELETEVLWDND